MDQVESATSCTLDSTDYRQRLAWIEQLNAAALRGYHREGARIELTYDSAAARPVREFVRAEQDCCPFLEFTVDEDENTLVVTIMAPSDVIEAADELFLPSAAT